MAKILVEGEATLKVRFSVELPMSEAEFDQLSERQQDKLLDAHIDWLEECRSADIDSIDVDDVVELEAD